MKDPNTAGLLKGRKAAAFKRPASATEPGATFVNGIQVVATTVDLTFVVDAEGRIIAWNEAAYRAKRQRVWMLTRSFFCKYSNDRDSAINPRATEPPDNFVA